MTSRIPYRNLPLLLLKARESLLANFRPTLNQYGLTEQQWRILRTLSEKEELEPRQLCEMCQILSPSLSGVLARMEETGLVERRRMPEDQRRRLVRLTAASGALIAEITPLVAEQYRLLEKALGKELVEQTYAVLDRLLKHEDVPVARVPLRTGRNEKISPRRNEERFHMRLHAATTSEIPGPGIADLRT